MPPDPASQKRALIAGSVTLAATVALGWLLPHERIWGTHFIAYLPVPAQATLLAMAVATVILVIRFGTPPAFEKRDTAAAVWTTTLLAGAVFLVLAAATALLGDGELWLNDVEAGASLNPKARAKLLLGFLEMVYPWLRDGFSLDARTFLRLISVLSGMAAVLAWLRLGQVVRVSRWLVLLTAVAWGGIALFFGYVEMYPPLVATVSWMFTLMISSLRTGRRGEAIAAITFGIISVLLNYLAVVFIPALAAFTLNRFFGYPLKLRAVLIWSASLLAASGVVYFALGWFRGTDVLLPFLPPLSASISNPNARAVLSGTQWLDFLNALMLCAGPVLAVAMVRRREWTAEDLILVLALLFPLAGLITHNAQLGRARDWDIAATFLAVIPVIGIRLWSEARDRVAVHRGMVAMNAAWILVITIPWIVVQHSETLATQRFHDLLMLDPGSSPSGWDYLATYYKQRGNLEGWAETNQQALKVSPNPRNHANLTLYYCLKQNWQAADAEARAAWNGITADDSISDWERRVTGPGALLDLAGQYKRLSKSAEAEQTYRIATVLAPENPGAWLWLIGPQIREGRWEEALTNLQQAACYSPQAVDTVRASLLRLREQTGERRITGLAGLSLVSLATGDTLGAAQLAREAEQAAVKESVLVEPISRLVELQELGQRER